MFDSARIKSIRNKLIIIIIVIIIILTITIIDFVQNKTQQTYKTTKSKRRLYVSKKIIYLLKVNTYMNKQINKCNSAGILNNLTALLVFF